MREEGRNSAWPAARGSRVVAVRRTARCLWMPARPRCSELLPAFRVYVGAFDRYSLWPSDRVQSAWWDISHRILKRSIHCRIPCVRRHSPWIYRSDFKAPAPGVELSHCKQPGYDINKHHVAYRLN